MKTIILITIFLSTITLKINIDFDLQSAELKSINLLASNTQSENDPKPITNFEVKKYMGKWHEQARTQNPFERLDASNITAEYTLNNDNTVLVNNCSFYNNKTKCGTGDASFVGDENVADLIVNFGKNPISRLFAKGSYKVVKTDYENFAFLYTRQKFLFLYNKVFGWILTREKNLSQNVLESYVQDFLSMSDLTREDLIFPENN